MKVEVNRRAVATGAAALLAGGLGGCGRRVEGLATSASIIRRAEAEGRVVVYGFPTFAVAAFDDFRRRFPKVDLHVIEIGESAMGAKVIAEAEGAKPVADIAWVGAMHIQAKLINDGYAQTYHSPEAHGLPPWAVWRDQGFGVTSMPIVFAYNKRLVSEAEMPRSHAALLSALQSAPERWRGKIATFDPERSAVGFLYMSADTRVTPDAWALFEAIAQSGPGLYIGGTPMVSDVASGKHHIAVNLSGYLADWYSRRPNSDIGYVVPSDYYLSASRVALITRSAPHPNAARLFLDYLMSEVGRQQLAGGRQAFTRAQDASAFPGEHPIRLGPALLADSDQARRAQMLARWRGALAERPAADG